MQYTTILGFVSCRFEILTLYAKACPGTYLGLDSERCSRDKEVGGYL